METRIIMSIMEPELGRRIVGMVLVDSVRNSTTGQSIHTSPVTSIEEVSPTCWIVQTNNSTYTVISGQAIIDATKVYTQY